MGRQGKSRKIGILALPGVQMLDVAGPLDVFAEANLQAGHPVYESFVIAPGGAALTSSAGLRLLPDLTMAAAANERFDTLLVAGAPHLAETPASPRVTAWLREMAPRARRYGSVCSGALLLAGAELLSGRRVTTHWAVADSLARRFPDIDVQPDALHIADGPVRTAAGVTAGLDLAVALVEEDLGREIAKQVAAQLVMFFRRPGGQLQFSRRGEANPSGRSILQEIQRWITANPAEDAGLAALAARAGLSPRHFARLFKAEIGQTPASWVECIRVDAARARLEAGERPKQVAAACGFGDVDTFRRAFQRQAGVTPADYRRSYEKLPL